MLISFTSLALVAASAIDELKVKSPIFQLRPSRLIGDFLDNGDKFNILIEPSRDILDGIQQLTGLPSHADVSALLLKSATISNFLSQKSDVFRKRFDPQQNRDEIVSMMKELRTILNHVRNSGHLGDFQAMAGRIVNGELRLKDPTDRDFFVASGFINLTKLTIRGDVRGDISLLASSTNLQRLNLSRTQVQDASALAALTNLQELDLRYSRVHDVSALAELTNLQELELSDTRARDVSALAALTKLLKLGLARTQVQDVSALAALTNLQELELSDTQVQDVSALRAAHAPSIRTDRRQN